MSQESLNQQSVEVYATEYGNTYEVVTKDLIDELSYIFERKMDLSELVDLVKHSSRYKSILVDCLWMLTQVENRRDAEKLAERWIGVTESVVENMARSGYGLYQGYD